MVIWSFPYTRLLPNRVSEILICAVCYCKIKHQPSFFVAVLWHVVHANINVMSWIINSKMAYNNTNQSVRTFSYLLLKGVNFFLWLYFITVFTHYNLAAILARCLQLYLLMSTDAWYYNIIDYGIRSECLYPTLLL